MAQTVFVVKGPDYEAPPIAVFTNEETAKRAVDLNFGWEYVPLVVDEFEVLINSSLHHYKVSADMSHLHVWVEYTREELQPLHLARHYGEQWHLDGVIEALGEGDAQSKAMAMREKVKSGEAPEIVAAATN